MLRKSPLLLCICFLMVGCSAEPMVDVVIQNGMIYDGTGSIPYLGTVAIKGDKIVYVGTPKSFQAIKQIDASNQAVSPGFINMLSWGVETLIEDGKSQSDIRQGITLEVFGEVKSASEVGDGPVDAIFKCIKKLYAHDVNLQLYNVHAVTEGTDAQATVSVRIEEKGKTTVGQAADTDTLVASANAYLNALNKLIIKRKKTAPDESLSAQI